MKPTVGVKPTPTPSIIIEYGRVKSGKTCSALFSFPHGLFLAAGRGALKGAESFVGYTPKSQRVDELDDVLTILRERKDDDTLDAVVVDDLSLLVEHTRAQMADDFRTWNALQKKINAMFYIAGAAPWHLVLNAHEVGPGEDSRGTPLPGGPAMPWKNGTQAVSARVDMLIRVEKDPARQPWPSIYRCDPSNKDFAMADRNSVVLDPSPQNLAEVLRLAGPELVLPQPRRLYDWQEEVVEKAARAIVNGADRTSVRDAVVKRLETFNAPFTAVRWTLRDTFDRAELLEARAKAQTSYVASFG